MAEIVSKFFEERSTENGDECLTGSPYLDKHHMQGLSGALGGGSFFHRPQAGKNQRKNNYSDEDSDELNCSSEY